MHIDYVHSCGRESGINTSVHGDEQTGVRCSHARSHGSVKNSHISKIFFMLTYMKIIIILLILIMNGKIIAIVKNGAVKQFSYIAKMFITLCWDPNIK